MSFKLVSFFYIYLTLSINNHQSPLVVSWDSA